MTPKAAPADNRFMTAAVAGMSRLRKTTISSRNDSATTTPTKTGSLEEITAASSSALG